MSYAPMVEISLSEESSLEGAPCEADPGRKLMGDASPGLARQGEATRALETADSRSQEGPMEHVSDPYGAPVVYLPESESSSSGEPSLDGEQGGRDEDGT